MFVNNKKITEELQFTSAILPATGASASSSALVDMSESGKYVAVVAQGAVTTAGDTVVSIWESTESTWAGAVATQVAAARTTVTLVTSGTVSVQVEVDASGLSKRYLGVHISKADSASAASVQAVRGAKRYL